MSQPRSTVVRLESFGAGLDTRTGTHRIADAALARALNVDINEAGAVVRRDGVVRHMPNPATVSLARLHWHTPSTTNETGEVWAIGQGTANFYRSTSSTSWSTVSVSDAGSTADNTVTDTASFNGKLYIAYKKNAGTNRLHCWDGSSLRRVGISTPSAPTVGDTGTGSYAATLRYYKVQFLASSSSKYTLSDLSDAVTFTPSGSGTHARITKPTTPDGAASWRVWASADGVTYNLLTEQSVATTTVDDNAAPSAYSGLNVSYVPAESGAYTPPWSAKYLLVDENRLLIAGAFETARYASRVGWSSIIGTAATAYGEIVAVNDDERFPPDNYLDLDSDEGGEITGMAMLSGSVYVFKQSAIYKLIRTGNAAAPYTPVVVSKSVGAVSRDSLVPGEDPDGNPCLYFIAQRGPYRIGTDGVRFIGAPLQAYWGSTNPAMLHQVRGVYDPAGVVRYWTYEGYFTAGIYVDAFQFCLHVRSGGDVGAWTVHNGNHQYVVSAALLPSSLASRNSQMIPCGLTKYFSYAQVVVAFGTSAVDDDTINSSGTVTGTTAISWSFQTKTFDLGFGTKASVTDVYLLQGPSDWSTGMLTSPDRTLTVTLSRDFGTETRSASETWTGILERQPKQITGLTMADAQFLSVTVAGSSSAPSVVDGIAFRVRQQEPL